VNVQTSLLRQMEGTQNLNKWYCRGRYEHKNWTN